MRLPPSLAGESEAHVNVLANHPIFFSWLKDAVYEVQAYEIAGFVYFLVIRGVSYFSQFWQFWLVPSCQFAQGLVCQFAQGLAIASLLCGEARVAKAVWQRRPGALPLDGSPA